MGILPRRAHFFSFFTSPYRTYKFRQPNFIRSAFQVPPQKYFYQYYAKFTAGKRTGSASTASTTGTLGIPTPDRPRQIIQRIMGFLLSKWALGLAVLIGLPSGDFWYARYQNRVRERTLRSAFDKGAVPVMGGGEKHVERKALSKEIESVLQPDLGYPSYNVIVGNSGTGKSTLVRDIGHQLSGIVYVDLGSLNPGEDQLAINFAHALHWSPLTRTYIGRLFTKIRIAKEWKGVGQRTFFQQVFYEFCNQAERLRKTNNRRPVLVLDNVDQLAFRDPSLLQDLQEIAKNGADKRLFVTVFIIGQGQGLRQMLSGSASSRMGPILEVGDLSHSEALEFLKNQGHSGEEAEQVYSLVGGRPYRLQAVISMLNQGQTFANVKATLLNDADKEM